MMKRLSYLLLLLVLPFPASAEVSAFQNTMESSGKIYVVTGVIAIILAGLFVYLFSIDRKLRRLENKSREKQS